MSARAEEHFLLAATIDEVEPGQRFVRLPAHVTLGYWFNGVAYSEFFERRLHQIFAPHDVLGEPTVGDFDKFGRGKDISVRRIDNVNRLPRDAAMILMKKLGGELDPANEYGEDFTPHITLAEHDPVAAMQYGAPIDFATVALIRRQKGEAFTVTLAQPLVHSKGSDEGAA